MRLQIIHEISLEFNEEVLLAVRLNKGDRSFAQTRLNVLADKRQDIIDAVEFYKTLPIPEDKLDTFCVMQGLANQYMFDVMGKKAVEKHLFSLLSAAAHFGFSEDDRMLRFYSASNTMIMVSPDGEIKTDESFQGVMFTIFLNGLFGHALVPTNEEFMKIDIASNLDSFMKSLDAV